VSKFHRRPADEATRVREIASRPVAGGSASEEAAAALALLVEDGMDHDRAAALLDAASRSGFDVGVVVRTALKLRETGW
jgi:hypothetical protein